MLVQIVLFDGFDLLDALAPYEVFTEAGRYTGGAIRAELVSAEGPRSVPSGINGLQISASGAIDPTAAAIIVVPGAAGPVYGEGDESIVSLLRRASQTELVPKIEAALSVPGLTVAAVCGGSLLLAMQGLLEGRRAATHHLGMAALGATGAIPVHARVVDDGNLVSGGGVTSGLDVALYIVERELGPQIAHEVEKMFEYEKRGTVWRPVGMQPIMESSDFEAAAFGADEREPENTSGILDTGDGIISTNGPTARENAGITVFVGRWEVIVATPIGKLPVTLNISGDSGRVSGTAVQGDERVEFIDPVVAGSLLSWSLKVKKPMRLNLKFEVTVLGDEMSGRARAGLLPASKVSGKRTAAN